MSISLGFDSGFYRRLVELVDTADLKSADYGRASSNLAAPTIFGLLAQQVEQWTFNPTVKSSILLQTTIIIAA